MTIHHPSCIPNSQVGVLAWPHNFNSKAKNTAYLAKYGYELQDVEDAESLSLKYANLLARRDLAKKRSKELTLIARNVLEGDTGSTTLPGTKELGPAENEIIETGLLARYAALIDQIRNHPNYSEADGIDLGLVANSGSQAAASEQVQSRVTLHRSEYETVINCTKSGDADAVGIEVDHGDGEGWKLLGVGTNAQWHDEFRSPEKPVVLRYRVTLYHRGHPIGKSAEASTSSQP
ncbi:MAG: hypothetical protein LBH01_01315 [Verrucomicrobiales bacterium]|jgi:hypothetical protein|nr:hypothetical protein [Verrucomicrobiales bacterium]